MKRERAERPPVGQGRDDERQPEPDAVDRRRAARHGRPCASLSASVMIAARVGPMHGVQPSPNRNPSSGAAREARPPARSGRARRAARNGTSPANARPSRIVHDAEDDLELGAPLDQPGADRARDTQPSSDVDRREAEHEEDRAGEHPAAAGVLEVGAREPGGVGEVARAAAGSRTGEKNETSPATRATGIASTSEPDDGLLLEPVTHPAATCSTISTRVSCDGQRPDDAGRHPALGVEDHGRRDGVGGDRAGERQQRLAARASRTRASRCRTAPRRPWARRCPRRGTSMPTKWAWSPSSFCGADEQRRLLAARRRTRPTTR